MTDDELLDEFWDASIEGEEIDHESFLAKGGEEVGKAVDIHKLLEKAAETWGEPTPPTQLGRFEVQGDLGAGGLGKVYLAWDPELRRHVAIKVIARDRWAVNEARSIARLDHRAVVKVYEVGHDRVVMELLDGGTLADKIDDLIDGTATSLVTIKSRLTCLARLAEGLGYCHQRGILHRDVKPANVLFAKGEDYPRLVDFGLAHIDSEESLDITQNLVGTPSYLAPEQVESGETGSDSRSDIFSFGILAHELLTLHSPFRRDTREQTLEAIRQAQTKKVTDLAPEVPKPVEHIVQHCLEADPNERYQTMEEIARDLHNALANRPISVGGRSVGHRARLLYRRNRRVTWVAAIVLTASIATSIGFWMHALWKERDELSNELDQVAERIGEAKDLKGFRGSAIDLIRYQERVRTLDSHKIGAFLFDRFEPRVRSMSRDWSQRLAQKIEAEAEYQRGSFPRDAWHGLVQLDANINPEGSFNDAFREGLIKLAPDLVNNPELILLQQRPRGKGREGAYQKYVPIEYSETLPYGSYLFMVAGKWTREILVDSLWFPSVEIQPTERKLDSSEWMSAFDESILLSPIITIGQAEQFFGEPLPSDQAPGADQSDPARCSWQEANEFAAWAGGRLPLSHEAAAALELTGDADHPRLVGEIVSDISLSGEFTNPVSIVYSWWKVRKELPPNGWTEDAMERGKALSLGSDVFGKGKDAYWGFRIVYDQKNIY